MIDDEASDYAKASYEDTCALNNAVDPVRNFVITPSASPTTDTQEAIAATYYRMCLWMGSLVRLKEPADFQAILHGVRCIYELWIDIADLVNEPTLVEKLKAFHFVTRFTAASKLLEALTKHSMTALPGDEVEREFIAKPDHKTEYDALRTTHWGTKKSGQPKTPIQWHDSSLAERAAAISKDEEVRYRRLYSKLCWTSHSGLINLSPESAVASFCIGLELAQDIFLGTTKTVADYFGILTSTLQQSLDDFSQQKNKRQQGIAKKYAAKMTA